MSGHSTQPIDADFADMHDALGLPARHFSETYQNYYCCPIDSWEHRRFQKLPFWDFGRFINNGMDAVWHVNSAGKRALADWMKDRAAIAKATGTP